MRNNRNATRPDEDPTDARAHPGREAKGGPDVDDDIQPAVRPMQHEERNRDCG